MNCSQFQRDLSALLDGELPGCNKETLEFHLRECPACSRDWERMRSVTEQVRHLGFRSMPDDALAEKVKQRIAEKASPGTMVQGLRVWGRVPLFAALVLIALGMGEFAGRSVIEAVFPTTHGSYYEGALLENGTSFGDIFLELTQSDHPERVER